MSGHRIVSACFHSPPLGEGLLQLLDGQRSVAVKVVEPPHHGRFVDGMHGRHEPSLRVGFVEKFFDVGHVLFQTTYRGVRFAASRTDDSATDVVGTPALILGRGRPKARTLL
eukprot:CAMPEP_0119508924 /NCGR_PEP_ID=MMETSP1344-20130328/28383_1 /TAXON_ID=236787 /ORGANISM="Florenciella parvula, Strain CCMP2471" /LENGTH=111 /DNA_ID=CAMNT_0007545711 /DNA_START=147 /DNA_END=482 /DNA_ORIENTATION=+